MMLVGSLSAYLGTSYFFRVTLAHLSIWWQHGIVGALAALLWLLDR